MVNKFEVRFFRRFFSITFLSKRELTASCIRRCSGDKKFTGLGSTPWKGVNSKRMSIPWIYENEPMIQGNPFQVLYKIRSISPNLSFHLFFSIFPKILILVLLLLLISLQILPVVSLGGEIPCSAILSFATSGFEVSTELLVFVIPPPPALFRKSFLEED